MRKFLLSMSMAFVSVLGAQADVVDLDFSTLGYANAADVTTVATGTSNISLELAKGTGSNAPKYYSSNPASLRMYPNNTMTFTAAEGWTIKQIEFTCTTTSYIIKGTDTNPAQSVGELNSSGSVSTWTGDADKVVFTHTPTSGQWRPKSIKITYEANIVTSVKPVEISYELDGADGIVTLTSETEDAEVYYGYSEDDITNLYSEPFRVSENCTVYAYAKKGDETSLTRSLAITLPYTSFKTLMQSTKSGDDVELAGDFSVIYKSSKGLMLTDGTSNMFVKGVEASDIEEGEHISFIKAHVYVGTSLKCYELQDGELTVGGNGASVDAKIITDLTSINYDDNLYDKVTFENCLISDKSGSNASIHFDLEGDKITLFNNFGLDFENGQKFTITGFVWRYKDELQICPISIEGGEFIETVKTPVISPAEREINIGDEIAITCLTPDVKIYYTLDGTDPTEESTLYTAPFTYEEEFIDFTVKAIAYYGKDDKVMFPSEIASHEYHIFDPTCNVISTGNHTGSGSYSKHSCVIDNVEYGMVGIHNGENNYGGSIQMNNSSSRLCYIIQKGENEGYVVDKITVDYYDSPKASFKVRASNTPFTDEKVGNTGGGTWDEITKAGVEIGEISEESPYLEFNRDYKYFALYPAANGVIHMNSVTINYRSAGEISSAPVLSDDLADEFDSDENTLLIPALPTHDDWTPMYQVNDGDIFEADAEGTFHDEALDPATLHTIKIWYEHYNGVDKSDVKTYNHLTTPQFSIENGEDATTINFGTIGEGVEVRFTLNGTAPAMVTKQDSRARARAVEADGEYQIDSTADFDATHVITSSTPVVKILPVSGEALPEVSLSTQAVHTESGVSSKVKTSDEEINIPTGISSIEAADDAEAIYFNLQGLPVANPENGTFIRVIKGKAEKVMK